MELNNNINDNDPLGSLDLGKIWRIIRKSFLWIILIVFLSNTISFLYLRYTKPVYESSSLLKLEIESDASVLGFSSPELNGNIKGLSGEIELLRSKLFFSRVANTIGYGVSYYFYGRYLTDERYKNSPFQVIFNVDKSDAILDKSIDMEILDDQKFQIEILTNKEKKVSIHEFNKPFQLKGVWIEITKTKSFTKENSIGRYYFVINSKDKIINYLQNNVTVVPENFNANTVRISLRDFNKQKAHDFINAIDTLYLSYIKETKNLAISQKIKFLDDQIKQTNETLEGFENYFEDFTIENRTISLNKDIGQAIEYLNALDSQKVNYQLKLSNVLVIEKQLLSNNLDIITPFMAIRLPESIKELIAEYTNLVAERELKLKSYNESTFVVTQLDYKIKDLRDQTKELITEYKNILNESLKIVDSQKKRINNNFNLLPSRGTEYNKNKRVYSLHEEIFLSLRQSKTELEIARAGTVNKSIILSNASLPSDPVHPKHLLIYIVGFVSGIVFSLIFVIARYLLHNTITTVKEVEQLVSVPILGTVPLYRKGKDQVSKMVVDQNPKSAISESFRSIRTNMDFLNADTKNKIITITSTVSGEGKTFVGVNLASIIALSGKKVCIVDLDMRKPKVNFAFEDETFDDKGVSTILIGRHGVSECLKETRLGNLQYISAGPTPPNPSELLLSEKFSSLIESLKESYDVIIFDTPPVGLVTDGVLVMKKSDLQIYVIRSDYSKRSYVKTLNDLVGLNKFSNLTVVFNSLNNTNGTGYGYGYGYGYYDDEQQSGRLKSAFKFLG